MTKVVTTVRFQEPEHAAEETTPEESTLEETTLEETTKDKNRRERTVERKSKLRPHRDAGNLSLPPTLSYHVVTMDLRALVVCPDQDSAGLLMLILSDLGMAPEHTPSISRGLELVDNQHFDAIVLDYRADQSSDEFFARLRQSAKNRASMLIAVVDGEFNARPVFGLGANFILYRPLSSERTRISLRAARNLMRRERRRAPRTPVSSTANVAYPGAPELNAVLTDLSDGGTLIHSVNRLPPACKVYFDFELPGQQQQVRLSGEVAWQDASGRTGIRFLDVPQTSRRLMQTWLQQNNAHPATGRPAQLPASKPSATQSSATQSSATESSATQSDPLREKTPEPEDSTLVSNVGNRRAEQRFANAGNRRGEHRFACKLGAEVYRLGTNVPNRCILSDISEGGCYVEMPSPLSGRSGVEILVRTSDAKLRITGQVLTTHPGFGMGVRFMFRDSVEREEILRLLAVLSAGPSLDEQHR
jgi:c-di-GMP-binding flagellar brake protein YcgR